ncbi:transcriptional regulator, partial [Klebsiella pneumoniae]
AIRVFRVEEVTSVSCLNALFTGTVKPAHSL